VLCSLLVNAAITPAIAAEAAAGQRLQAPDFVARTLDGDTAVRLSAFADKVVLLNFWASWCFPCRAEMPEFQKLYNRFKDDGLVVVAVAVYDERADAQAFKSKYKFSFPVWFDDMEQAKKAFNIEVVPQTFLIGRDGRLVPIPNPKTNKSKLVVNDPTIWPQPETYRFFEALLKQ